MSQPLERRNTSIHTWNLFEKKDSFLVSNSKNSVHARKKYQQQPRVCWKDCFALCKFVSSLENKSAHIVGHIDSETAKKWLDWNLGELFVVAWDGDFVFCFEGGTIVYLYRVEGYARATLRHFFLLGVVFSSPSRQCNGVFLFSSASMPANCLYLFFQKESMCWRFFVCCLFPIFSEWEQEHNGPRGLSKGCCGETFAYVLPFRQVCCFFRRFVLWCGNFLHTVFGQFHMKGFVLLAFGSQLLQECKSSTVWRGYHLYGVPHDGFSFLVLETSRRFDVQIQPSKYFETRDSH